MDSQHEVKAPEKRQRRVRQFLSSNVNIALLSACIALVVALAVVLALVTVPDLKKDDGGTKNLPGTDIPINNDGAKYAVIKEDFPDPCIVWQGNIHDGRDQWWAFATRDTKVNVRVASAQNMSHWTYHEGLDAMPTIGKWAARQLADPAVWAPSVVNRFDGSWVLYYSALAQNNTRKHCIGAAVSNNVSGPYIPLDEPIVCEFPLGGVIDPAYFHDPITNTSYLVYKQDGNAIGVGGACANSNWPNAPTPLLAVELDVATITQPVGKPFVLLDNIRSDGSNIEAPLLWYYEYYPKVDGANGTVLRSYHLSYNSGCFAHTDYRIQHIICVPAPATGIRDCAWNAVRDGEIFASTLLATGATAAKLVSPGGAAISTPNQGGVGDGNFGKGYMPFHADTNLKWFENPQKETRVRSMFIAKLEYWGQEDMLKVVGLVEPGTDNLLPE